MTGRRGGHRPPVSTANDESKVQTIEKTVQIEQTELLMAIFGAFDEDNEQIGVEALDDSEIPPPEEQDAPQT